VVERNREEAAEVLRRAGLRVTANRLAVVAALGRRPHADTESIIAEVRRQIGPVSAQGVYNALAAFSEAGVVRRIEPAGSVALYELRVADNHHHVVCRKCGAVQDVDCAVGRRPCLTPSDTHGYLLDEAEVTYWGFCPECQDRPRSSARSAQPTATTTAPRRAARNLRETPAKEDTDV
jgi:Fe2+ or Zn2+ uptake regulation protein